MAPSSLGARPASPEFTRRVSRGEPPVIFGNGEQTRDFIHVSDVDAVRLSLRNERARSVFNIGDGEGITINRLANLIFKLMGREDLRPVYALPRPGDIVHSIADITRAWEELRFKQKVGLETGIKDLIRRNVI